ncbi:MAG TPA: flagellar hook basal-body protein [Bryobacteraceae bacterium]|jgi:flagellar basal-body rod protein FlgF|nr:flagellar hook basal-body protein [Bryobacteraceae bacterium]
MDGILTAAASGMRARMESLDLLANNIANQATAGFKADREAYTLYSATDVVDPALEGDPLQSPLIQDNWTDFSPGTLQATGDQTHLALDGPGYFHVRGPSGELLTRSGTFRVSSDSTLVTANGYAVLSTEGQPIQLRPNVPFSISRAGVVTQRGAEVGTLQIQEVSDATALKKHHGTYFHLNRADAARTATKTAVLQGHLEGANVAGPESSVRLIEVLRQFETLQKAIQIGAEMGRRADEVARVGN